MHRHVVSSLHKGLLLVCTDPTRLGEWGQEEEGWMHLAVYLSGVLAVLTLVNRTVC